MGRTICAGCTNNACERSLTRQLEKYPSLSFNKDFIRRPLFTIMKIDCCSANGRRIDPDEKSGQLSYTSFADQSESHFAINSTIQYLIYEAMKEDK
ncbi:hypothetical protein FACS189431_0140 [Alphaproteobacteria bacterium]|nr:hypothetical protein FACS189431_0140 [Alphaproteobacteria bacterium]